MPAGSRKEKRMIKRKVNREIIKGDKKGKREKNKN